MKESSLTDTEIKLEYEEWTPYTEAETPEFFIDESQNYSKIF